ncbi:hypothetical protein [Streptomyces hebeiensis]
MDQTLNRHYPYPECDPPVQKDASDIIQLAQLATAINDDVQQLSDTIEAQIAYPPSGRMDMTGFATTSSEFVVTYTTSAWTTRAGLTDTGRGGFVVQQPGWYLITGFIAGPALHMRTRLVVNGTQRGVWQGYSRPVTGIANQAQELKTTIFLDAGDFLTNVVRHATAGSVTFEGQLAVVSMVSGA